MAETPTDRTLPEGAPVGARIVEATVAAREPIEEPAKGGRGGGKIAAHLAAAILAALGLIAVLWFFQMNPALPGIFVNLLGPWRFAGGTFDWAGLAWGIGAVALLGTIGRFYLEGLEIYLPRSAQVALGWIFGFGIAGFIFELLAIPFALARATIGAALIVLLVVLVARAVHRSRRPPESGWGGEGGAHEQHLRRLLARQAYRQSLTRPRGPAEHAFRWAMLCLIGAITLINAWHALLYPEVYWDSMILYLGYARMTFLEGGFPIKVVGQVGIGLGANYPHLFSVVGSAVAVAAGAWSELPQRLMTPLAGLATTVLVYHSALRLTRHVNFALAIALIYRAIPLAIYYDQNASDYAYALLFAAAFLYLALLYIETGLSGYFSAMTLLIGLSMHLNYLMGILWLPWLVTVFMGHAGHAGPLAFDDENIELREAPWTAMQRRASFLGRLGERQFWTITLFAAAVGSTWLIRNWIVTGNPVYAFFYQILGGENINPEVMRAAAREWAANGWGIGRLDEYFPNRLRAAWTYFFMAQQSYQTAPIMLGFALGGLIAWLGRVAAAPFTRTRASSLPVAPRGDLRFGFVVTTLLAALLAFHFVLAPYYLYQIVKILPCLALLAALGWPLWRMRPWRWWLGGLALAIGIVPGLAMSLMGWKVVKLINLPGGRVEGQLSLYPLRNPLPPTDLFYRWQYGDDALMWQYINEHLKDQKLLTHDNRHLAYDPSITLVHLDDWDVQALWQVADPRARVRRLMENIGARYYLYIPNEDACETNKLLGTAAWPELGLAELVHEAGPNKLYRLQIPLEKTETTVGAPAIPAPPPLPSLPQPADAATTMTIETPAQAAPLTNAPTTSATGATEPATNVGAATTTTQIP